MSWAGISAYYEDTFWTNSQVRSLIKQHFGVLTSRKNVYNGRAYKDDDTIFAWDVYNVRAPTLEIENLSVAHI